MSIVGYSAGAEACGEVGVAVNHRVLHRLATVRRLQGLSRRTVARRMNVEVAVIRRQEDETSDLPLSVLYEWQKVLEVPIAELLVDSDDALSQPLLQRAQLVRLMKTALALLEQADNEATRLMAQTLVDQLIEVMPELQGISAWHAVGRRRSLNELGIAATRSMSEDIFVDLRLTIGLWPTSTAKIKGISDRCWKATAGWSSCCRWRSICSPARSSLRPANRAARCSAWRFLMRPIPWSTRSRSP